jgi:hypothetical protein
VLTGISPFAARPRASSFDLNTFWNSSRNEPSSTTPTEALPPPKTAASAEVQSHDSNDKDDNMDLESQEANDQDFDMFLEEKEPEAPAALQVMTPQNVEALPPVWSGKVSFFHSVKLPHILIVFGLSRLLCHWIRVCHRRPLLLLVRLEGDIWLLARLFGERSFLLIY